MTSIKALQAGPVYIDGYNEAQGTPVNRKLVAGTAKTLSIPENSGSVIIQADQDCSYRLDGTTAVLPFTDSTTNILLAAGERRAINLFGVTSISIISDSDASVSAVFWSRTGTN